MKLPNNYKVVTRNSFAREELIKFVDGSGLCVFCGSKTSWRFGVAKDDGRFSQDKYRFCSKSCRDAYI